jgi:hypothetical protein
MKHKITILETGYRSYPINGKPGKWDVGYDIMCSCGFTTKKQYKKKRLVLEYARIHLEASR